MAIRTTTVVGAVVAVGSMLVAACGVVVMILLGSDSSLSTGHQRVRSSTAALVAPVDDIDGTDGVGTLLGDPRLRLSVRSPEQDVFIGVGPARAVDRYLAGADIDRVDDLDVDPFRLELAHRRGTVRPATPAAQPFWVAKSSGAAASLEWKVRNGDYRIVVMNVDGTRGVDVDGTFTLVVPHLYSYGLAAASVGLAGTVLGVVLVALGVRRPGNQQSGPPHQLPAPLTVG